MSPDPAPLDTKVGRPTIKPGEPSIDFHLSLEVSSHRRLRYLAQLSREPLQEIARVAIREYIARNLTVPQR